MITDVAIAGQVESGLSLRTFARAALFSGAGWPHVHDVVTTLLVLVWIARSALLCGAGIERLLLLFKILRSLKEGSRFATAFRAFGSRLAT